MRKLLFILLVIGIVAVFFIGRGVRAKSREYIVQPGDTLAEIAARYGVTVDDLVALNRDRYPSLVERPDRIEVGWRLRVPEREQGIALTHVQEQAGRVVAYIDALAMTATAPEPEPTPTPRYHRLPRYNPRYVPQPDPEVVAREIFEETNKERTKRGLAPLVWDEELAEIARWRVQDMVRRNYYSHYDPQTTEPLIAKRCAACGENLDGEYIATGRRFVNAWLNSPGHRANMLNPRWTAIGVGVAKRGSLYIAIQVFR